MVTRVEYLEPDCTCYINLCPKGLRYLRLINNPWLPFYIARGWLQGRGFFRGLFSTDTAEDADSITAQYYQQQNQAQYQGSFKSGYKGQEYGGSAKETADPVYNPYSTAMAHAQGH